MGMPASGLDFYNFVERNAKRSYRVRVFVYQRNTRDPSRTNPYRLSYERFRCNKYSVREEESKEEKCVGLSNDFCLTVIFLWSLRGLGTEPLGM